MKTGTKLAILGGVAVAAIAVLFVLPAETGWDPTGVGEATGLTKIADPDNPELERGQARMAQQDVLTLSDTAPTPQDGVHDEWTYELGPYESVEFKYTIPEGEPVTFRWEATGPVNYDMHAHPFDGGEELTESYGIDQAESMQGTYNPAFTGIHGWFFENRSLDTVTLTLVADGGMTTSTIFGPTGATDRALIGADAAPVGSVEGHTMQGAGQDGDT